MPSRRGRLGTIPWGGGGSKMKETYKDDTVRVHIIKDILAGEERSKHRQGQG